MPSHSIKEETRAQIILHQFLETNTRPLRYNRSLLDLQYELLDYVTEEEKYKAYKKQMQLQYSSMKQPKAPFRKKKHPEI